MSRAFHQDRILIGSDLRHDGFPAAEFERCTFRGGQWMQADLRKARFTECTFEQCDLSNVSVDGTGFRTVAFKGCKLLGVRFDRCHTFLLSMRFDHCRLDFASFRSLMLKGIRFNGCSLVETDLSGADLANAVFQDCDLAGALFEGSNLTAADLREARNYVIDPEHNKVRDARFAWHGLPGLLMRHGIKVE